LAKHQGISSLGYVMAIGVATCMIAGVTVLPAILTILCRRGWRIKGFATEEKEKDPVS
jgi:uncharacterized membrane protein YdfJ with MMPL/SSD domain